MTGGDRGTRRRHEIKVWPPFFEAILDGTKTFEVRFNDRDYRAGDVLDLRDFSPETGATGRSVERVVRYVLLADDAPDFGLEPGFCVMSLAAPDRASVGADDGPAPAPTGGDDSGRGDETLHSRRVSRALRTADKGEAYHWPTIAAILAREVRRLASLLETQR